MRKHFSLYFTLIFGLTSCSPFDQDKVVANEESFLEIFEKAKKNNFSHSEANGQDAVSEKLRWNRIDRMEINYADKDFYLKIDSVAIFIKKATFFSPENRIVYDFAKKPRLIGGDKIVGASYERTMISERWYFETIGWD